MQFHRNMLPHLGVSFHTFESEFEAMEFAKWAEQETRYDEYPCEAFVTYDADAPFGEQYEVKVRNW